MSWNLRESAAKWDGQPWSVDVDLTRPSIRFCNAAQLPALVIAVTPRDQHTKQSTVSLPLGEAYVRQKDLIAIFPESAPGRFGYQIDMRVLPHGLPNTFAIEIWLSVQTSLLDSNPQLELHLSGETFKLSVNNCWTSESSTLGLLVHPLDQQDCHMESIQDGLAMRVFGRFMEKGVIRRMRFQLIATTEAQAVRFWQERFEEFSDSPLPLTT